MVKSCIDMIRPKKIPRVAGFTNTGLQKVKISKNEVVSPFRIIYISTITYAIHMITRGFSETINDGRLWKSWQMHGQFYDKTNQTTHIALCKFAKI